MDFVVKKGKLLNAADIGQLAASGNNKIDIYAKKIPIINSDTKNIIEYVEQTNSKKKKYKFWKLLNPNE